MWLFKAGQIHYTNSASLKVYFTLSILQKTFEIVLICSRHASDENRM
jgi:hypothetical protein